MKKIHFAFIALIILMSTACNNDSDKNNGTMDSIGNPTPNPKHTDTLRSNTDTIGRTDSLHHLR